MFRLFQKKKHPKLSGSTEKRRNGETPHDDGFESFHMKRRKPKRLNALQTSRDLHLSLMPSRAPAFSIGDLRAFGKVSVEVAQVSSRIARLLLYKF